MRIIFLLLVFSLVAAGQSVGSAATASSFEAKNAEAREAFKVGKFDEALRLTLDALTIGKQTFGDNSPEIALVHNNLGVLYRSKEKYQDAMQSFEESLRLFEKLGKPYVRQVIATHEAIGVTHRMAGRNSEAEKELQKAIDIAEHNFGPDSFEMYSPTFALARYSTYDGKITRGDDLFLQAYRIAYLRKGSKATELESIRDTRTCLVVPQGQDNLSGSLFDDKLEALRKSLGEDDVAPRRTVSRGIVNGKATSLIKPSYPASMANDGKSGAVVVRVLIETDGTVLEARATCGHPDFAKNAVKAALKSKFSPTSVDGQAVRVNGIIVYNFVR